MFEKILAIDVEKRISDGKKRLQVYSKCAIIFADNVDELSKDLDLTAVDAILISIHQTLSLSLLKKMAHVRYIGVLGTSIAKIPMDYCHDAGILVFNVTDYCDHETAEWVISRNIQFFRNQNPSKSVFEKRLGIIGVGAVGKHVIKMACALGMEVLFNTKGNHEELLAPLVKQVSKEEIFSRCDVVSIHTPPFFEWLTDDLLSRSKKNFCLINTAMGRISRGQELENFLIKRPDVVVIMDKIAGESFLDLKERALIFNEPAFLTIDSTNRLITKFFFNLERFNEQHQ